MGIVGFKWGDKELTLLMNRDNSDTTERMDSDEEKEEGPSIGGPRTRQPKLPNPMNEPERQRKARRKEEQAQAEQARLELAVQDQEQEREVPGQEHDVQDQEQEEVQEVQEAFLGQYQSKLPDFGDGSEIITDLTTSWFIRDPIDQHEDTCASVVFTHLLEAAYNKGKPKGQRRELSIRDLAGYIKSRNISKDKFSFRNLNIPINYIKDTGLYKEGKTSGLKTMWDFGHQQDATKEMIHDKLVTTPLGIVLECPREFESVGMGIHFVRPVRGENDEEHALLVLARGITKNRVEFLVVQNSWGTWFGNNGYCRISLPENCRFRIFWPC